MSAAAQVEHFWTALANGWDIEPRDYFEKEAVEMGFKSPVEMAVHWMWKRHAKDWPNAELAAKQAAPAAAFSPSEELTGDEVSLVVAHLGSGPFKNRVLAMLKAEPNIHGRLFTFRDLREHGQDWGGNPWPSEECEVCHGNTQNGVWVCMLCLDELKQKALSPSEEPKKDENLHDYPQWFRNLTQNCSSWEGLADHINDLADKLEHSLEASAPLSSTAQEPKCRNCGHSYREHNGETNECEIADCNCADCDAVRSPESQEHT